MLRACGRLLAGPQRRKARRIRSRKCLPLVVPRLECANDLRYRTMARLKTAVQGRTLTRRLRRTIEAMANRGTQQRPPRQPRRQNRSRFQDMVRSLRHRNFQLFFSGQMISLIGTWMQNDRPGVAGLPPDRLVAAARRGRIRRPDSRFSCSRRSGGIVADRLNRRIASSSPRRPLR